MDKQGRDCEVCRVKYVTKVWEERGRNMFPVDLCVLYTYFVNYIINVSAYI